MLKRLVDACIEHVLTVLQPCSRVTSATYQARAGGCVKHVYLAVSTVCRHTSGYGKAHMCLCRTGISSIMLSPNRSPLSCCRIVCTSVNLQGHGGGVHALAL